MTLQLKLTDVYQEVYRSECNPSSGPHLPAPFHINLVNMRRPIRKTPNNRDAFHSVSSEFEQTNFSCTWVRIAACFFVYLHHSISVNVLSLLLIWSHPWRDTDWFMADVCSLMKSNHAIGLLSQLFVRLFWCFVLSCYACDVVCRVQASSTRFCYSLKCTDQIYSLISNHFTNQCQTSP